MAKIKGVANLVYDSQVALRGELLKSIEVIGRLTAWCGGLTLGHSAYRLVRGRWGR
jgi:hypothetical protein